MVIECRYFKWITLIFNIVKKSNILQYNNYIHLQIALCVQQYEINNIYCVYNIFIISIDDNT